ncbi:MAG: 2,4-dihydroxyhept-2-ene,7-dioic acid aldolase [Betaproteobacteria bacterium]|jgi:4-hydroxy-2-oxoheptanedioate aldolase|nr:2,4-dihydroxyhept-2-ene,7-dioic acid aldolase [Betaproteobacteria bacterium]
MAVKINAVRQRLRAGHTVVGIIVFTASPMVVEIAAASGLDFVILDMEHSPLDLDRAGHLMRAADAAGITPFVRIPGVDRALINKLLNLGAAGIVLPHANSVNCSELLKAMRYAPEGERGSCQITRAAGYVRGNWDDYASMANEEVMAIALVEDAATLVNFEAFAGLDGIDAYFVGPTDLSIALGVPGATFDDKTLGTALNEVIAATKKHGKYAMTLIGNKLEPGYATRVAQRGVQIIVLGTDGDLFANAITSFSSLKS